MTVSAPMNTPMTNPMTPPPMTPIAALLPHNSDIQSKFGGMSPGVAYDHLTEVDVISSRAAKSRVREKTSIPQYSINPRDTIFTTPFSNGIFPP